MGFGLDEDEVISIAVSTNDLIALSSQAISKIDLSGISPIEVFDIPSIGLNDLAIYGGIAYIATDDIGLARFDLTNDSFLAPWGSTGVNNADNVPLALQGDTLHLGLPGYGVVRKDLSTGEILTPFTESGSANGLDILPSDNIFALISDGSNIYIGTDSGAVKWDGIQALDFQGDGSSWTRQPSQFFDFALLGSDIYVGTNIGVCRYPTSTVDIDDCIGCYRCERACPVDCIKIDTIKSERGEDIPKVNHTGVTSNGTKKGFVVSRFTIDMSECCFCNLCTYPCPEECIFMVGGPNSTRHEIDYEFSEYDRNDMIYRFSKVPPDILQSYVQENK